MVGLNCDDTINYLFINWFFFLQFFQVEFYINVGRHEFTHEKDSRVGHHHAADTIAILTRFTPSIADFVVTNCKTLAVFTDVSIDLV